MIRPIVSASWLMGELGSQGVVAVDTRWYLADSQQGRREFEESHIPGAVFMDLESDLSGPRGPGRHPLPSQAAFAQTLGERGIGNETHVVAYDHGPGSIAARLWWLLRHVGHYRVSVLDGGYAGWTDAGYQTSVEAIPPLMAEFVPGAPINQIIDRNELEPSRFSTPEVESGTEETSSR